MSSSHFYQATISFFSGVFISILLPFSVPFIAWLILLGFVSVLIWSRSALLKEVKGYLIFGIILIAFSGGALRVEIANWSFGNSLLEEKVGSKINVTGIVETVPDVRESVTYLEIKTEEDKILVSVDKYAPVTYGDKVSVTGKLTKPESFETDLGRTFDYPGYLKAKGIEYRISFASVSVLEQDKGNPIIATLLRFKLAFMKRVEVAILEPAAGLGEGLLLGVKQALGEELEAAFRKTGIIHIVVLSGYNIMLVVLFVMYILGHFLARKPRVVVGIIAIVAFALLVGLSATVVRASIMAVLLLVVQATGRKYLALRGLMVAGTIMIINNPFLLVYDVGFQLSFLATLGLILISPYFEVLLDKVPNFIGVRSFLVATISTQLAVLPLLLYQIGEFSVVSIIVNVLVLPMVPVAMLLTFITGLVAFVSPSIATVFSYPAYLSLTYISEVAWWFAKLPFAAYIIPLFSFYLVPVSYVVIGLILWFGQHSLNGKRNNLNSLLHQSSEKVASEDFSDWDIEEENDEFTKKTVKQSLTVSSDTPIFFR